MMFPPDTIVRLRNDPARAGRTTGVTSVRAGRTYHEVRLADGSGVSMLPEAQLEADAGAPDPMADLRAGRFADPDLLRRLLLHHRLTGRLRDVIYSMDVTDTDFHAYQFKPVVKLLGSPSQGLLIADEVGLGKTIEAGLIWTELVARFDCHRLLVVCPKSLTEKWRLELWSKFSVDARIVDASDLLDHLRREGERSDGFALIVSLSSVRPPREWEDGGAEKGGGARAKLARFLADQEGQAPLIDCLIIDEAHHLRNADTMNHAFGRLVSAVSDYRLLLSATPINLRSEDLRVLLALLDPDTFESSYTFQLLAQENRPLVAAREMALDRRTSFAELVAALRALSRGEILRIDEQLAQLQRELSAPGLVDGPELRTRLAAQLEEMSLLGSVVNRTRRRDINELQVRRRVSHFHWHMGEAETAFYRQASDVVREHAWSLNTSELFLLATPQRLIASSLPAAHRHWARHAEDFSEDDPDVETQVSGPLVGKLAAICADPARGAQLEREDTKFDCLLHAIAQTRSADDNAKLIIFSSFRVALDYLAERLRASGAALEVMHGGVKEDRLAIINRFAAATGPCLLLTSEVGGEGLDMQFCRSLINYDLPWNPMKVEQRIGRIDRIGQRAESVEVVSLICAGTIEDRIYDRLYRRLLEIEQTLGAFEAIVGDELAALERRLLDPKLSAEEQVEEIDRRRVAIEEVARQTRELEEEAPGLIAHGDMIMARIEANHRPERRVGASELADYVHEALAARYPGTRVADAPGEPGLFDVQLSAAAHLALRTLLTRGGRFGTRLTRETKVRAAFERASGLPKTVELVTSVHPLVRLAAQARREAAGMAAIQPVVHVTLHSGAIDLPRGEYVAAIEKWRVDGALRVDRIVHGAAPAAGEPLDPLLAERLVQTALREGRPSTASVSATATNAIERLRATVLEPQYDGFVDEEAARHADRTATGRARLERQHERRVRDTQWRIEEWKRSGDARKLRLIPALEGKLNKLLAHLDVKRAELRHADAGFSFQHELIGLAVITIQ